MAVAGQVTVMRLTRVHLLLAAGMAVFGSGTPVSKVVTEAFPVFLASGIRMAVAAALLAAVLLATMGPDRVTCTVRGLDRKGWMLVGGIAVAGMFLFSVFMLYGMKEIPGAVGGVVMATTPAVTAAGAVLFLREHLDRWQAIGIGCAVAGVSAVNLGGAEGGGSGSVALGTALVFGAVCGEAAYTLLGKRLMQDAGPLFVAAAAAVLATLLFAPLAVAQATTFDATSPGWTDWLAVAWWGIGTMALGSVLWYAGVQRVPAATASGFMAVMPLSAVGLSYLLLDESFAWSHAAGLAAVLAGIAALARSGSRSEG